MATASCRLQTLLPPASPGIAAVSAITLVFVHVYFAILPEKRMYLRAMIKGWLTREELAEHHEPPRKN